MTNKSTISNPFLYNCCERSVAPDWTQFDGFEIAAVHETVVAADDRYCEPIHEKRNLYMTTMWTVYGHLLEGGVMAITDVSTEKLAISVADLFTKEHLTMDKKQAISLAISVLDVRADQWAAAVNGSLENCIDELYEASEREALCMEADCRGAIQELENIRDLLPKEANK